jgi:hypothetical protein
MKNLQSRVTRRVGSIEGDPFIPAADGGVFGVFSGQMRLIPVFLGFRIA